MHFFTDDRMLGKLKYCSFYFVNNHRTQKPFRTNINKSQTLTLWNVQYIIFIENDLSNCSVLEIKSSISMTNIN